MNFFEAQQQARQQSKRLVLLFVLAVIAIIMAIDLVVVAALLANSDDAAAGLTVGQTLAQHTGTVLLVSLIVGSVIALASLFKIGTLRSGGAAVAQSMGGTLISAETTNPHHRRLRNVVEEIAIASGVPVPEIYVLEQKVMLVGLQHYFEIWDPDVLEAQEQKAIEGGLPEALANFSFQGDRG